MLLPKEPIIRPPYQIYRGFDPEAEGNKPMKKTEDVIENLGSLSDKLLYACKVGLKFGIGYSLYDVFLLSRITERKAQLARAAFFCVPAVAASVGWMGGLEVSKQMLGKDRYVEAHVLGATVPAGVYAIWRRRPMAAPWVWAVCAIAGTMYQYSVQHNMLFYRSAVDDNPNEPNTLFDRNISFFMETKRFDNMRAPTAEWLRREPTWKKFEEAEK